MSDIEKRFKVFNKVLEKHGTSWEVFEAYYYEDSCRWDKNLADCNEFSSILVMAGFEWADTNEGHKFWREVHLDWQDALDRLLHPDKPRRKRKDRMLTLDITA